MTPFFSPISKHRYVITHPILNDNFPPNTLPNSLGYISHKARPQHLSEIMVTCTSHVTSRPAAGIPDMFRGERRAMRACNAWCVLETGRARDWASLRIRIARDWREIYAPAAARRDEPLFFLVRLPARPVRIFRGENFRRFPRYTGKLRI